MPGNPYDTLALFRLKLDELFRGTAGAGHREKTEFEERHVLFMGDGMYLDKMMSAL